MLGNAMRRSRVKNSASNQAAAAIDDATCDESAGCQREKSDCAEKHGKAEGDEDVAEAADEAKLFVVGRGGQFRRLADIFQRAEALSLFGSYDALLNALRQNFGCNHRHQTSEVK